MRNEMRGFFFLSYALICVCMSYLCGGLYYGGGLWAGLALIFLIISVVFFSNARDSKTTKDTRKKPAILCVGKAWTEFNCFQLKVDNVAVKKAEDGRRFGIAMFHVENWLTVPKQGENKLSVQMEAIAEQGKHSVELEVLNANSVEVAAGEQQQAAYNIVLPEKAARILLTFSVTVEQDGKVYQQKYEFYPAHYER